MIPETRLAIALACAEEILASDASDRVKELAAQIVLALNNVLR